jgi:hypothetical protein
MAEVAEVYERMRQYALDALESLTKMEMMRLEPIAAHYGHCICESWLQAKMVERARADGLAIHTGLGAHVNCQGVGGKQGVTDLVVELDDTLVFLELKLHSAGRIHHPNPRRHIPDYADVTWDNLLRCKVVINKHSSGSTKLDGENTVCSIVDDCVLQSREYAVSVGRAQTFRSTKHVVVGGRCLMFASLCAFGDFVVGCPPVTCWEAEPLPAQGATWKKRMCVEVENASREVENVAVRGMRVGSDNVITFKHVPPTHRVSPEVTEAMRRLQGDVDRLVACLKA